MAVHLRRTCGSLLAALDVHPRVAMALLCHSLIALTMKIYIEVPEQATRDALGRLSGWLDEAGGGQGRLGGMTIKSRPTPQARKDTAAVRTCGRPVLRTGTGH